MRQLRSVLGATLLAPFLAFAQGYPSKPMHVVVPYAAGGASDNLARVLGAGVSEVLGQPVLIENRPGANGLLGTDLVAKSAPDAYTLLVAFGPPHDAFPFFLKNVPFDPIRDFTPISMIGIAPQVLAVHPSMPVTSVRELIDYAKRNPGKLSYGAIGVGAAPHVGALMFNRTAGIDMVAIPYKGGGQVVTDLISGQIQVAFQSLSTTMPHVRTGRLRLLTITDAQRAKLAPDAPTVAETALPGYFVPEAWLGMLGPAKLPETLVSLLHGAVAKTLGTPDVRAKLESAGFEIRGSTPQQFSTALEKSYETYRKIAIEAAIKPQ